MRHPVPAIALCGLLVSLLALLALPAVSRAAETLDPDAFYGFWEFQEPAGDTSVVIIKRGGRASCFWAGSATRTIEKGAWDRTDSQMTVRWDNGHVDVFRKLGDNAIERDSYEHGQGLLGKPGMTIRGVRVDSRLPGSLTIRQEGERTRPEEMPDPQAAPALPMRNTYLGYWKVDQSRGLFSRGTEPHFYLHLMRNGEAQASLRNWDLERTVRGAWVVEGERVVVTWPDQRRDIIEPDGRGSYTLGHYRPRDNLKGRPNSRSGAAKVVAVDAQRYFDAGNFRQLTVDDIRGTWLPEESTGRHESIAIEGWGNAYRNPSMTGGAGTDPGKWKLLSDRVIITWVDGSKDVIRFTFPNVMQDSYRADQEVTGTPLRSVAVLRAGD